MIDLSNAKRKLNAEEEHTVYWLSSKGFDNIKLISQTKKGTEFEVTCDGVYKRLGLYKTYEYAAALEAYLRKWYDEYMREYAEEMDLRECREDEEYERQRIQRRERDEWYL